MTRKEVSARIHISLIKYSISICLAVGLLLCGSMLFAQKTAKPFKPLEYSNGKLSFTADSLGNRIPDFSYCGYQASNQPIPGVAVKIVVPVSSGDATLRIQSAINYVSKLPMDANGFRGAVLLEKGTYEVFGQLKITTPGIVLRGSGAGANGTILLGAGTGRETLVRIFGKDDKITTNRTKVISSYVPVGTASLKVADASSYKAGDLIIIHRPSTLKWIYELATYHFGGGVTALGWKPGERDIYFERQVKEVQGNEISFEVPLTTALDTTFGGATVSKLNWPGRIHNIGIENMQLVSAYDTTNPKDEAHRWMAITMENVQDAWVRQLTFKHFAGSAVNILSSAKQVTVEDCISVAPVSEIGGQRRYTFLTAGQQTLVQRCYAENGYHDFAVGFCAPGPNAFVQCQSELPFSFSGTIDSWASGVLFDIVNVDGDALRFGNRGQDGQGAGWTAANSVFWQCSAARIDCYKPPTANNYAYGSWAQFAGDGYWESSNEHVIPRSLYYEQLAERLGDSVSNRAQLLPTDGEASSSPPVSVAMELTAKAVTPPPLLSDWIALASERNAVPTNASGTRTIDDIGVKKLPAIKLAPAMQVKNGWIVRGDAVVTGSHQEVPWWSGGILPPDLPKMKPHITRWVPGKTGTGLTDDLDSMTDWMKANNKVAIEHNYGLWYDRRRDDHERVRRMNGEVWPPFYELPFKRSGKEIAWDGLSKYDLTQYNPWYWSRLKQFADLADQKSLVLIHQNYFQHNIIEAGAHYVDFPWRTANNINGTGFPEPVPFAGDKRIFLSDQFYDVTNAQRRKLHTAYIRQCLNNFKNNTGVIQLTGAEFTGPLHFVQFWIDVVKEWEKETNIHELVGLSATKDVQDEILADPGRAGVVDIIDIRYWHYQEDGKTYEPKGGQNLAPRQHARLLKPKRSSFEQVYRAVREYRTKYPGKAVMYSGDSWDSQAWAVFMAGGSLAAIPFVSIEFLEAAGKMKPIIDEGNTNEYILEDGENNLIAYSRNKSISLKLNAKAKYKVRVIDPGSGRILKESVLKGGDVNKSDLMNNATIVWISAK